jgi:hypothetical protein
MITGFFAGPAAMAVATLKMRKIVMSQMIPDAALRGPIALPPVCAEKKSVPMDFYFQGIGRMGKCQNVGRVAGCRGEGSNRTGGIFLRG